MAEEDDRHYDRREPIEWEIHHRSIRLIECHRLERRGKGEYGDHDNISKQEESDDVPRNQQWPIGRSFSESEEIDQRG